MKQSSTDFLIHHILHSEFETDEEWQKVFEQAKEMHKQEIIEAYDEGQNTPYEYSEDNDVNYYDGRNYYKNTYEKE